MKYSLKVLSVFLFLGISYQVVLPIYAQEDAPVEEDVIEEVNNDDETTVENTEEIV